MFSQALREDLLGRPIRVTAVDARPGETEFSLVRFKGDEEKAAAVYQGVEPLTAGRHRRLHPLRAHPPAARERRRDRRQGARAVERRPHPRGPVSRVALTILEGSTFCICDERGDIGETTAASSREDTRFLSLFRLTMNGEPPLLLSSDKVEYYSAAFYLRNPLAGGLPQDSLSIVRERFVGDAMQDRIVVQNSSTEPVSFELALEIGERLRGHLRGQGARLLLRRSARRQAAARPGRAAPRRGPLVLVDAATGGARRSAVLRARRGRRRPRPLPARARPARALGARRRRRPAARTNGHAPAPQRFGEELALP